MAPDETPESRPAPHGVMRPDEVALDRSLVRRVRRGDMEAYGELVRRHMRRAYSIAFGILQHREDAEDVVQEAFARTLESIDRMDERRAFHPWLHRIVVNTAIDLHRSRAVRRVSAVPDDMPATGPWPDRSAELGELRDRLLAALAALPERERTIVLLADVEELSSGEVAEIMGIAAGTVRYHLHRARHRLRRILPATGEEVG